MGRSGKLRAKHDYLIREFLQDTRYEVREDGTIWTRIPLNGRGLQEAWRPCGKYSGEGYIQIRYQGVYLQAHRVVYQWKYGTLKDDLIVDHKNTKRDDNHPDNLKLVTQSTNQFYRHRRKGEQDATLQPTSPEEGKENPSTDVLEGSTESSDEIDHVPF